MTKAASKEAAFHCLQTYTSTVHPKVSSTSPV
jgi:hypothetical protein